MSHFLPQTSTARPASPLPFCPEVKLDSLAPKHRPAPRESTSASTTTCPRAVKHQRSSKTPGAREARPPADGLPRGAGFKAPGRLRRRTTDPRCRQAPPRSPGPAGAGDEAERPRAVRLPPQGAQRAGSAAEGGPSGPGPAPAPPAPPRPGSALCPRRRKLPPARSGRPAGRRPAGRRGAARRGRASRSRSAREAGGDGTRRQRGAAPGVPAWVRAGSRGRPAALRAGL